MIRPRGTTRAAAALGTCLLAVAGLAGSADAAASRFVLQQPSADQTITEARPVLKGFVYMTGVGPRKVMLTLKEVPDDPDRPPLVLEQTIDLSVAQSCVPVEFTPDPLAYNGKYEATVTAPDATDPPIPPSGDCANVTEEPRGFFMAVLPAVPTGVAAAVDKATRMVTVTWAKNPEPDVVRYEVHRAKAGEAFQPFGQTTRQSFVDGAAEAGDYRYQVIALRRGAKTNGPLLRSDASAVVTANVPAPPRPPAIGTATRSAPRVASRPRSSSPPDTGFRETLPFANAELEPGEEAAQGPQLEEIGTEEERSDNRRNLAALAAGLLITVFVMHLLWVKGEVDREPLEAIGPD